MLAGLRRLCRDDRGQDLIEYALITAAIGFAGLVAFQLILTAIGATYGSQEAAVDTLWEPNGPVGAGS